MFLDMVLAFVIILRGGPASGKTTVAEQLIQELNNQNVQSLYLKWDDSFEKLNKSENIDEEIALEVTKDLLARLVDTVRKRIAVVYVIDGVFAYDKEIQLIETYMKKYNLYYKFYRLIPPDLQENLRRNRVRDSRDVLPNDRIEMVYHQILDLKVLDNEKLIVNIDLSDTVQLILQDFNSYLYEE